MHACKLWILVCLVWAGGSTKYFYVLLDVYS